MQEVILKKVVFGGYDCADVMNHINALQIKLNRTKRDYGKVSELQREAEQLRSEIKKKDEEILCLKNEIDRHEEDVRKNQPSKMFFKQTEKYADNYIESARSLGESVKDLTAEHIEDAKENIGDLQQKLDDFSRLLGETFSSVSDLKKEYRSINKSYKEILNKTADEKKEKKTAAKKATAKKTEPKAQSKKSEKKSAKVKSDNSEALELIRQTEEKYNNI